MTTLLAIESSSELASVALLMDDRILCRELTGVQTHSHGLLPVVAALLAEADVPLSQCDAIAFGCGPGAFTGVRTACGVVQGLAFGADLPVVPVVSLLAMVERARRASGLLDVVSVLDARMSEAYWAHYRYLNDVWDIVCAPALARMDDIQGQQFEIGTSLALGAGLTMDLASVKAFASMPHAEQVAQLGLVEFVAGRAVSAEFAQPLYLRNKVALTTAERLQVKASATVAN